MKERIISVIKVILMIGICMTGITLMCIHEGKAGQPTEVAPCLKDTISPPRFFSLPAKDGLRRALTYYDIQHPEIVYAQAILETGHFKSVGCLKHNNLFGLYDSKKHRYCRFDHWTESVVAYKEWIQRRYEPPNDYYLFLKRIGYAKDPEYVNKLKQIVNSNDKRKSSGGGKDNS